MILHIQYFKAVAIFILFIIILAMALLFWPHPASSQLTFGQCLTQKGVTLYGVDTCDQCLNQKQILGHDFTNVRYVNCDFEEKLCRELGITVYPFWVHGSKHIPGIQSIEQLSKLSGCKIP